MGRRVNLQAAQTEVPRENDTPLRHVTLPENMMGRKKQQLFQIATLVPQRELDVDHETEIVSPPPYTHCWSV